jgi:hypothetical protein
MPSANRLASFATLALGLVSCVSAGELNGDNRVFAGVETTFHLRRSHIRRNETVQVDVTLKNIGHHPVTFRLVGPLIPNIELYDANRKRVDFRTGFILGDYPVADIELVPGQVFKTTIEDQLTNCYELPVGRYYIRFIYDLRLISDETLMKQYMRRYHTQDYTPWSAHWYPLFVSG